MAANAASLAQASTPRTTPTRDPPKLLLLTAVLVLVLMGLLVRDVDSLVATLDEEWGALLFWAGLIAAVSFFPIKVEDTVLTVDEPILLTLALLYPPEIAALVGLLASIDVREFKREIVFARAVYNRAQVGLSVYLAGVTFRSVTGGELDPWQIAILGTAVAVAAEYVTNVLLVSLHARVRWELNIASAVRKLKVGRTGQFLATHLGYGSLALVLAHVFRSVGAWSVVTFLVPILVARQMLIRGQAIEVLAEEVRDRDALLTNVSQRLMDERRDERLRVAGELHDGILQELTKLWLLSKVVEKRNEASPDDVKRLGTISEASIESLRSLIHHLRNSPLGRRDLLRTLDSLVRDARLEWKTKINLEVPPRLNISAESEVAVYQVAREAVVNALRHGEASTVSLRLQVEGDWLILEVKDDGFGFQPEVVDTSAHFGIALMKDRAQRLGGDVRILSTLNEGTKVRACFPLPAPHSQ